MPLAANARTLPSIASSVCGVKTLGSIFTLPPRKALGSIGVGVAVASGVAVDWIVAVGLMVAVTVGVPFVGVASVLRGLLLKKNRLFATIWG